MEETKTRIQYIKELRKKFLIVLIPCIILFFYLFYKTPMFISYLTNYYEIELYNFSPAESIAISMNFALFLTLLLFVPAIIYQLFSFSKEVIPKETKGLFFKCSFGFVLAIIGFIIGSTVFTKIILDGLMVYNIGNPMWSIASVLRLGIIFGSSIALSFQLMWFVPFLTKVEIIEKKDLKKTRPFIFIGLLVLSAVITPPDVISQVLMIIPLMGSFEIGLLFSKSKLNIEEEKC